MFKFIVAVITLPLWLVPFGPIIWIAGLCLALLSSGRTRVVVLTPEAAIADKRENRRALHAAIGIIVVIVALVYLSGGF